MPDLIDFFFDCEPIQSRERKAQEQTDSVVQQEKRIAKRFLDLLFGSTHRCWVGYAPMGGHRLTGPDRADLFGRIVANRKNKIELWSPGLANSSHALLLSPFVGMWAAWSWLNASGRTVPDGWLPAL
jgi:hypothetical protein